MPEAIVFSRTKKAQDFWQNDYFRSVLVDVLRNQVGQPESFGVTGNDFLVDHVYVKFPEDARPEEPDVLILFVYSVRPQGLVRMKTGTHTFTKEDTARMLKVLKRTFPMLKWGPWDLPQHEAGYSEG